MFEIWKDCELGGTYIVETVDTFSEAYEKVEKYERLKTFKGWHLRIVNLSPEQIREKVKAVIKTKNNLALCKMIYSENKEIRDITIEVMTEKLFEK